MVLLGGGVSVFEFFLVRGGGVFGLGVCFLIARGLGGGGGGLVVRLLYFIGAQVATLIRGGGGCCAAYYRLVPPVGWWGGGLFVVIRGGSPFSGGGGAWGWYDHWVGARGAFGVLLITGPIFLFGGGGGCVFLCIGFFLGFFWVGGGAVSWQFFGFSVRARGVVFVGGGGPCAIPV